jgi:C4-dicarboxylate transporter DctQ subunit
MINKIEEAVLCIALVEMSILTFIQVVMRYVFGVSITWAEELLRYQICFVAFFGADIGLKHNSHIGSKLLHSVIPPRFIPLLEAFIFLVIFFFCLIFAYYGLLLVLKVRATGQITAAIRMSKFLVYLPIPLAGLFMCIRSIFYFARDVRKFHTVLTAGLGNIS